MAPTAGSMSTMQRHRAGALRKLGVLERQRAYALTGRPKHRIEYGRSGHANGRFPNPTPEIAGGHHDRLDFGEVFHEHPLIAVQILLRHAASLDGAFLVEHRAETEGNRTLGLHRHLLRINGVAAVDRNDQTMDFELPTFIDGDLGCPRA